MGRRGPAKAQAKRRCKRGKTKSTRNTAQWQTIDVLQWALGHETIVLVALIGIGRGDAAKDDKPILLAVC